MNRISKNITYFFLKVVYYSMMFAFLPGEFLYASDHQEVLSLKQLCDSSNHIVLVSTESLKSFFTFNKKHIYTEVHLKVIESYKGTFIKEQRFTLRTYGGTIDSITIRVVGGIVFQKNQRSILFLRNRYSKNNNVKYLTVLKSQQGKFDLTGTNNSEIIRSTELQLPGISGGKILTRGRSINLTEFLKDVKQYIERSSK